MAQDVQEVILAFKIVLRADAIPGLGSLQGLGACSYLVCCLAGGLICQSSFWLPSGMVAVRVSSHLPEMVGRSKAWPFFSKVPLTCRAVIWGLR